MPYNLGSRYAFGRVAGGLLMGAEAFRFVPPFTFLSGFQQGHAPKKPVWPALFATAFLLQAHWLH